MREIIVTLDLKTINTDRDSFSDQVMEKASRDMEKLGIEILSCNIQNVIDENGLINDLGMDNTSKIKKDAQIVKLISAIDKVIIYDSGNGQSGVSQVSGNMPVIMKQVFDTMSEATGVDFREIMKAGTYDAKVNRNINVRTVDSEGSESLQ